MMRWILKSENPGILTFVAVLLLVSLALNLAWWLLGESAAESLAGPATLVVVIGGVAALVVNVKKARK